MSDDHHVSIAATSRLRVVVLGYLIRGPVGGMAWHHLQYVLGLHRLGHDVLFIEDSTDSEWSCYNPSTGETGSDASYGLGFAAEAFDRLGLGARFAFWNQHPGVWLGPRAGDAASFCASADLLLSLSGINPLRVWTERIPRRAYVDTDPVFTQAKHMGDAAALAFAREHTHFFTFGENFGKPGCTMPDDGLPWRPTRQPVVLDAWPVTPPPRDGAFSTVMLWESYAEREIAGVRYGMKSKSFAAYRALPSRTTAPLELALGGAGAPAEELRAEGWRVRDPLEVALRPWDYQAYIRGSLGEFGVAKHGYASTRSGWFSERTAAYMASGRVVVVQDTGFGAQLPTGRGLFAFSTIEQAMAALDEARRDPLAQGLSARDIVAEYFESGRLLTSLVEAAMR